MILIGLTGPISHGKTTFANALKEIEPTTVFLETWQLIAEVANALHAKYEPIEDPYDIDNLNKWLEALPAIVHTVTHKFCAFEQIKLSTQAVERHPIEYQKLIMHVETLKRQPELAKQPVTAETKELYRPLLQWLGGYLVEKVDNGIWWDEMLSRIKNAERDGCELCLAGALRFPADAAILRKAGATIVKVYRPGHLQNDMLDPTERERENIKVDCTIVSNGTVEDLKKCAATFLQDIKAGKVKAVYESISS